MSSVEIILDVLELAAGVTLTYFVFYLYQKEFRSGVMEKGFRMIAISMLIFTIGQSFDLITAIQTTNELASILTTVTGTTFSLVATYGFFLLYRVWHVDRKEVRLEKTINA
jgi:Kef-type K+ transport system membrane component KefB